LRKKKNKKKEKIKKTNYQERVEETDNKIFGFFRYFNEQQGIEQNNQQETEKVEEKKKKKFSCVQLRKEYTKIITKAEGKKYLAFSLSSDSFSPSTSSSSISSTFETKNVETKKNKENNPKSNLKKHKKTKKICERCKQSGFDFKRCSKCRIVYYCSAECQLGDWKVHRTKCQASKPI